MINKFRELPEKLKSIFNNHEPVLNIFDNYSILSGISKDNIVKLVDAISKIEGLKTVNVYMNRDYNECPGLYLFASNPNIKNKEQAQNLLHTIEVNYNNIREFIIGFFDNKINCNFYIYKSPKRMNPDGYYEKFHGRYWITESCGMIVDGSMNSIEKNIVLAQKCDEENFEIIKGFCERCIFNQQSYNIQNIDQAYNEACEYVKDMANKL